MKRIKIAVLDSGFAEETIDNRIVFKKQIYWDYLKGKTITNSNVTDYNGHGTACINTILSLCSGAEIYVIKILGISGNTSCKVLLEALQFVNELEIDLIVLAASIVNDNNYKDKVFDDILRQLKEKKRILIAAAQNGKEESAIASNRNVIGVKGMKNLGSLFMFDRNSSIQMICDATPIFVRGRKGRWQLFNGNSKATAVAAGSIANYLWNEDVTIDGLFNFLEIESKEQKFDLLKNYNQNVWTFLGERERYFAENDDRYLEFVFLLSEYLKCNDSRVIRQSNLLLYKKGELMRDLDAFMDLVEERLQVRINRFEADDLMWAYQFYEKHVCKNN